MINAQTLGTLLRTLQAGEATGRALSPLQPLAPTQAVKPVSSEDSKPQQAGARDAGAGDGGRRAAAGAAAAGPEAGARDRSVAGTPRLPPGLPLPGEPAAAAPAHAADPAVVVTLAAVAATEPEPAAAAATPAPARGLASPTAAVGHAPPAAPAMATAPGPVPDPAASLRLSGAAQLIDTLAQLPAAEPVRAPEPLTDSVPTPEKLAAGLARSVARSGVFYESHLASWTLQQHPEAQLRHEPQAAWPALPATESGSEAAPAPPPLPAATSPTPTAPAATTGTPPLLPDAAPALVRQQLDVLETGQFVWRGDVWPGQPAEIEIAEDSRSRGQDIVPVWRTRVALALPTLGGVQATLALAGNRLQLTFTVDRKDSAKVLAGALPDLVGALSARAFEVGPVVIGDEPPA